jgi:hypothetical protein
MHRRAFEIDIVTTTAAGDFTDTFPVNPNASLGPHYVDATADSVHSNCVTIIVAEAVPLLPQENNSFYCY